MGLMRRSRLRTLFVLAGLLFIASTVASGIWSAFTFLRMSRFVGDTLQENQEKIDLITRLGHQLEREDDALLLAMNGNVADAEAAVRDHRRMFDESYARLWELLDDGPEKRTGESLRGHVDVYRDAGDRLIAGVGGVDGRTFYHETVNPVLRRAVADGIRIQQLAFESMQQSGIRARDDARRATGVVAAVLIAALLVSTSTALLLARAVVRPIGEMTESVEALRRGDFKRRVPVPPLEELARLASGFNRMAEELSEFHSSRLGEVLRAKQTLEATLSALPDAVILIDPWGRIASINPSAGVLLRSLNARRAKEIRELPLPSRDLEAIRSALAGRHQPKAPPDYRRTLDVRLGGRLRRLLPTVVPIPRFTEDLSGAAVLFVDVTDFARLDELRTELIALVSHELKTPLTSLRMNLLMLCENADRFDARQQEILRASITACEEFSATIDELLDLSRVEAGQLRLSMERLDLNHLVERTLASFRDRFASAGVELRFVSECRPAVVRADAMRVKLVISNLLTNALKYSPPERTVVVRLSGRNARNGEPGVLRIAVTDAGPGVPEEFRDRIFEKFFRVEQHRAGTFTAAQGAGFGLYLCRQIVEAHGGTIRCESGEDSRGTTIAFELTSLDREPSPAS